MRVLRVLIPEIPEKYRNLKNQHVQNTESTSWSDRLARFRGEMTPFSETAKADTLHIPPPLERGPKNWYLGRKIRKKPPTPFSMSYMMPFGELNPFLQGPFFAPFLAEK